MRPVALASFQLLVQLRLQASKGRPENLPVEPPPTLPQGETPTRRIGPRTRIVKQGVVDDLFIRQELYGSHSPVVKQKGASILLDGHDPLSRQPHHHRGKHPSSYPTGQSSILQR